MPVRIYDLAKKLGIETTDVLSKAKDLGITQAKYPSSSLDIITAAHLEIELIKLFPAQARLPVPSQMGSKLSQLTSTPSQSGVQQPKNRGISVRITGIEIHDLFERILSGEVNFVLEVARDDGTPPQRAKLVPELSTSPLPPKRNLEPSPRAELDERTTRVFIGAYYYSSSTTDDGWVNLAEFGSTLKKQDPTFQAQDFGEKSLGGLVRRLGIFDIKTDSSAIPVYFIRLKANHTTIPKQPIAVQMQEHTQPKRHKTGKIHNLKLGFGFIAPDDGSENAFFHATEVIGCTIFDLRPGDPVEYEAGENEQGPCAWRVRRLD